MVTLPSDYSELINTVSTFTCPKSSAEDTRVPAMCLICGEVKSPVSRDTELKYISSCFKISMILD